MGQYVCIFRNISISILDYPFVYYFEFHEEDNVSKYISYTLHK